MYIKYTFKRFQDQGILVKKGYKFNIASWIQFEDGTKRTYNQYGINLPQSDDFDVARSDFSVNQTTDKQGVMPGLIYSNA